MKRLMTVFLCIAFCVGVIIAILSLTDSLNNKDSDSKTVTRRNYAKPKNEINSTQSLPEKSNSWGRLFYTQYQQSNVYFTRSTSSVVLTKLNANEMVKADFKEANWFAVFKPSEKIRDIANAVGFMKEEDLFSTPFIPDSVETEQVVSKEIATTLEGMKSLPIKKPACRQTKPYLVSEISNRHGVRRVFNVRLSKRMSESELRAIALELMPQGKQTQKPPVFIYFYPPGWPVDDVAWATATADFFPGLPKLEVIIQGLTPEEEYRLKAHTEPRNREIIGRWIVTSPYLAGRITIFREAGKLFHEHTYKSGTGYKREVAEGKSPRGRFFYEVGDSRPGDYYVIVADGNLQLRDEDGLISTAEKF